MSNIPKLQAHTEQSGGGVKVAAHNKEVREQGTHLTMALLCPAVGAALSARGPVRGLSCRRKISPRVASIFFSPRAPPSPKKCKSLTGKKGGMPSMRVENEVNARRKTHRGVASTTRAHAKVLWFPTQTPPTTLDFFSVWRKEGERYCSLH